MTGVAVSNFDDRDVPYSELDLYERYWFLQKFRLWYLVLAGLGCAVAPATIWLASGVPTWVALCAGGSGYLAVGLWSFWLYKRQRRRHALRAEKYRRRVPRSTNGSRSG